jgi:predicted TIM-barrel fold metal-dependent hydrolase
MKKILCLSAAVFAALAYAQAPKAQEPATVMKFGVPVKAGPMDSVLLKDYQPESSLVVPETRVPKAKFAVIDIHTHDDMNNINTAEDVAAWVKTMDAVGVETSIVFIDAVGEEFAKKAALFLKYPNRFQVWCGLDTRDFDKPGYSQRAVAELERCYRNGARGVGELSDKGWGFQKGKRPIDKRLHLDDPRLDAFWQKCAELKMPVNVHVADHPSCWRPLGPNQERTPDFQAFSLYGKDVPSYQELLARRDALLERNPKTTFVFCHLSNQGNDLAALAKTLDRFPNFYVDISARDYEVGREPRAAGKFLAKYADRVMFGTDMGRDQSMYEGWWRLLESADEYMPGRLWWRQYGLELPAPLLEKLYRTNARRLLNWQ